MSEYSSIINELLTEYPEYKDMTLEEIADDMSDGAPPAVDEEMAELPPMPELAPEEEEEALLI